MRKRFMAGWLAVVLCLGLAGCGENVIPDLTEKELQAIGEYTAFTMMKYDASSRSRLVDLPQEPAPSEPEETEPSRGEADSPEMGGETDTPVTDAPGHEDPGSMEDVLELADGVSVSFMDAELCDTYPHDEEFGELALPASKGKKLLVLHFMFSNATEQDQTVDIASRKDLNFRITVNENYRRNAMIVLLPEDMTGFRETVPAGGSAEAVLIIEVEQESMEEISSIVLNLKSESKAYTIQLK